MTYVVIGVILLIAVFTFSLCKIAQKKEPKLFVVFEGRQKEKPSPRKMFHPLPELPVKETYRETEGRAQAFRCVEFQLIRGIETTDF